MTPRPPSAEVGQARHSCARVTIEFLAQVQEGTPFVDIEKVKSYDGHAHLF